MLEGRHDQIALSGHSPGEKTVAKGPQAWATPEEDRHVPEGEKEAEPARVLAIEERVSESPMRRKGSTKENQAWLCLWPLLSSRDDKEKRKKIKLLKKT